MTLWVILTSFVLILATGASIGVALGLSSAIVLYAVLDMPLIVVVQRMFTSVDSFSFMAVPFFMLAGAFMSDGGVTRRIVDFSMALVGALAGGLALVVAVAGMFFAALSGSSAATTAARAMELTFVWKESERLVRIAGTLVPVRMQPFLQSAVWTSVL